MNKSALALLAEKDGRLAYETGSGSIEVKAGNGVVNLTVAEFNKFLGANFIEMDGAPANGTVTYRITAAGRRFAMTWA